MIVFVNVKDGMASTCDVLANKGSSFKGVALSEGK